MQSVQSHRPMQDICGAISKTAAGGLINCLDPGGVRHAHHHQVDHRCLQQVEGSTLNSGGINGFVINDISDLALKLVLRGIEIDRKRHDPGSTAYAHKKALRCSWRMSSSATPRTAMHPTSRTAAGLQGPHHTLLHQWHGSRVGVRRHPVARPGAGAPTDRHQTTLTNTRSSPPDSSGTTGQVHVTSPTARSGLHLPRLRCAGFHRFGAMLNGVVASNNGGKVLGGGRDGRDPDRRLGGDQQQRRAGKSQ